MRTHVILTRGQSDSDEQSSSVHLDAAALFVNADWQITQTFLSVEP